MLEKNITDNIDPDDPWARDKLGRKEVADYLTPVIASIRQPFVVSLHSEYGTGKSFFLECWKQDLENQGFKVVLFNAWETDFSQDALSAFMASMKRQLAGSDDDVKEKFTELAKNAGGFARTKLLPVLAKAAARKLVGSEGFDEINSGFEEFGVNEDELVSLLSSTAVEALAAQEAAEQSMDDFKRFLTEVVVNITEQQPKEGEELTNEQKDRQKLIVFVDELDRCRPTYAVEVLECIKHLFNVEGMVFVLAIDDVQMRNAIASVYGPNLDGEGYLRKFIDWQFILPTPKANKYGGFLFDKLQFENSIRSKSQVFNVKSDILDGIQLLDFSYGLTLRQVEHIMAALKLMFAQLSEDHVLFTWTSVLSLGFEMLDKESFYQAMGGYDAAEKLCEKIDSLLTTNQNIPENWDEDRKYKFLAMFINNRKSNYLGNEHARIEDEIYRLKEQNKRGSSREIERLEKKKRRAHDILSFANTYLRDFNIRGMSVFQLIMRRVEGTRGFLSS